MKDEKLYYIEIKLLFRDVDTINNELPKIKGDLRKIFEGVIVHYDLSDEVDGFKRDCVGVRIELSRYGAKKDLNITREMSKDAVCIIKKYDVRDFSVKIFKV